MTSTAGTRPSESERRTKRWLTMARNTPASCNRICFCSGGGKMAMMRLILSTASSVCRVEKFDWVFDGDDVFSAGRVDAVDHRGERCRLTGARDSRHQHQAARHVAD